MPSYRLFDDPNERITPPDPIDRQFRQYHARNPRVYATLVQLAREAKQSGRTRIGIKMLWEVVRWNLSRDLPHDEVYKLPNQFHSRYARLIMQQEPDLDGIFALRELRATKRRD